MADALVSPAVGGTMWAAAVGVLGYALTQVKRENVLKSAPLMGVAGALVFTAQMINVPIPMTGASGHLGGAVLLTMLLGPSAAFVTLSVILALQALLFGDGGLLALGCNIINMGFWGCFVADALILRPLLKPFTAKRLTLAVMLASIFSLQCGALGVVLETWASGVTALPLGTFLLTMLPIHLAIGIVEGLITVAVLSYVYAQRPEVLNHAERTDGVPMLGGLCAVLALAAVVTGAGISHFASENPDGLEWSVERVAGEAGLAAETPVHQKAGAVAEKTAVMPDYDFAGESAVPGTAAAGLFGGTATLLICMGAAWAMKKKTA